MEMKAMYDLSRFLKAQERDYDTALSEIRSGHKRSHWIWYIFPQIKGLGYSYNSNYYGIKDAAEAGEYLAHPILGNRLREVSEALLGLPENLTAREILGDIDALKVKSSMTLFYAVSKEPLFRRVLDRYYNGELDHRTINKLHQ